MKRRVKRRQNPQVRAFELFCAGKNVFQVAEELDIKISDARKYHNLFLSAEALSPEEREEVTESLVRAYRAEQEKRLRILFSGVKTLSRFDLHIGEALFFMEDSAGYEHWDPDGIMVLFDFNKEIRYN